MCSQVYIPAKLACASFSDVRLDRSFSNLSDLLREFNLHILYGRRFCIRCFSEHYTERVSPSYEFL